MQRTYHNGLEQHSVHRSPQQIHIYIQYSMAAHQLVRVQSSSTCAPMSPLVRVGSPDCSLPDYWIVGLSRPASAAGCGTYVVAAATSRACAQRRSRVAPGRRVPARGARTSAHPPGGQRRELAQKGDFLRAVRAHTTTSPDFVHQPWLAWL